MLMMLQLRVAVEHLLLLNLRDLLMLLGAEARWRQATKSGPWLVIGDDFRGLR
jgi:hypothetical protein